MEALTFYKYHPCTQLAHLYEHLFVDALNTNLVQNSYVSYLDFTVLGKTFGDGIVEVEILAREAASAHIKDIFLQAEINTDEDAVMNGIAQLVAEIEHSYTGDEAFIYSELNQLDTAAWQIRKTKPQPDIKAEQLFFATIERAPVDKFELRTAAPVEIDLFPIFYIYASAAAMTIAEQLIARHALFMKDELVRHDNSTGQVVYELFSDTHMEVSEKSLQNDLNRLFKSLPADIPKRIEQAFGDEEYARKRLRLDVLKDASGRSYTVKDIAKLCTCDNIARFEELSELEIYKVPKL